MAVYLRCVRGSEENVGEMEELGLHEDFLLHFPDYLPPLVASFSSRSPKDATRTFSPSFMEKMSHD
jgi:hypothetical protein